jgi:hypothetical protein
MGSWDACCGISKLPIRIGDPVADFFIGEVAHYRDSGFICYSNDLWTPVTIQTYGVYDDYGRIVPDIGWHTDYVAQMLSQHAVPLEQGENPYHDIPIDPAALDYDKAQEAIHEGRLYLTLPDWVRRKTPTTAPGVRVTRMMVHRFVFDALVSWGIDNWRLKIDLEGLVQIATATISKRRDEESQANELLRQLSRFRLHDDNDEFLRQFRDAESGDLYVPHRLRNYLDYLMDIAAPDVSHVIDELAKFIIFRFQLSEMQFLWTPQIGSQGHAYDALSKLYRLCDVHAQRCMQFDDN